MLDILTFLTFVCIVGAYILQRYNILSVLQGANTLTVITPSVASRGRRLEIIDRLQTHTLPEVFRPRAAYDGRSLFSLSKLNLTQQVVSRFSAEGFYLKIPIDS